MSKLPRIKAKEALSAFQKAGYELARTSASHHILKKEGQKHLLSIPVHGGKDIGTGLLSSLIKASDLTVDEFIALL